MEIIFEIREKYAEEEEDEERAKEEEREREREREKKKEEQKMPNMLPRYFPKLFFEKYFSFCEDRVSSRFKIFFDAMDAKKQLTSQAKNLNGNIIYLRLSGFQGH